jgi:hypothetical protein
MSFEILIETDAAEKRLTEMIAKLQVVPIPAELTAWQVEDMKRKHPNTEVINPTTGLTQIWPRGRTQAQRSARPQRTRRVVRAPGKHPILRPALFDKLVERMRLLMNRSVTW